MDELIHTEFPPALGYVLVVVGRRAPEVQPRAARHNLFVQVAPAAYAPAHLSNVTAKSGPQTAGVFSARSHRTAGISATPAASRRESSPATGTAPRRPCGRRRPEGVRGEREVQVQPVFRPRPPNRRMERDLDCPAALRRHFGNAQRPALQRHAVSGNTPTKPQAFQASEIIAVGQSQLPAIKSAASTSTGSSTFLYSIKPGDGCGPGIPDRQT